MDFHQKICVITGASSGIGKRVASDLAARGATVCVVARRRERLEELIASLPPARGPAHTLLEVDVSDRGQVAGLADHVRETYGRLDMLINNAGISGGRAYRGEASVDFVEEVFRTNFFGAVYCTSALLDLLEASAPSHVVNVASVAGRVAFGNASAYCGSKFALVGWSESIHYDLRPRGVYVSLIEPGPVPTEGFPQAGLIGHPVLRRALSSSGDVSRAIQSAIAGRRIQRTVPRYLCLAPLVRLLAPGLYRFAAARLAAPNASGR